MSTENLEFLNNALKYLGFGENAPLNTALEERIAEGAPSFELETDNSFDGETLLSARLFFRRAKNLLDERYFLNKYEAHLQHPGTPEKDIKRMFYIESSCRGVTFKQAFNLLQGRFVQRQIVDQNGDKHQWWLYLEPKLMDRDGYHYLRFIKLQFDLEKALEKYPIREAATAEGVDRICRSLRRGNLQTVTFVHESGKVESRLLYANPSKGVIGNIAVATSARQKKGNAFAITELPEIEHPTGDPISESALEEEPTRSRKKAHL